MQGAQSDDWVPHSPTRSIDIHDHSHSPCIYLLKKLAVGRGVSGLADKGPTLDSLGEHSIIWTTNTLPE